ncbi:interleukin 17a/f3 [Oncorhynchus mykiss]|uniref:interleukin 17a/f3 n=1 Tax=Oncorhynchus mykiss TaxID=8022 RepID=UPI00187791D5|nr:interleukin 17a/f3 [Oncorhynchus mykiss]
MCCSLLNDHHFTSVIIDIGERVLKLCRVGQVFRGLLVLGLIMSLDGHKKSQKTKRKAANGSGPVEVFGRRVMTVGLVMDPNLKTAVFPVLHKATRSLSPWTYSDTYDETRVPKHISQAQCQRSGCLTPDGEEDMGLESKPILYQTLVLRRVQGEKGSSGGRRRKKGRKNKGYFYKLDSESVNVGCTCVRPSIFPQKQ